MSTEKYHSLTAYAIYLIVPGCESPLELKRCSEAAEGQLWKGSRALTPALAPSSCWSQQLPNPTKPPAGTLSSAVSYTAALAETSAPGCTSPALYRQRVKCLRNGITDLTRDQPKGAKEILGWGRAKHHRKRQTGAFRRWTPTPGQSFPIGKTGERESVAVPWGLEHIFGTRGDSPKL